MEGGEAGADDCDVLGTEGGQGAAYGEGLLGAFGGEDAYLDDGYGSFGVDELHGDEDAVVPFCDLLASAFASNNPFLLCRVWGR